MTSKERVMAVLAHEKPDRVPTNIGVKMNAEWRSYFDGKYGPGFVQAHKPDLMEVIPALPFPVSPSRQVDGITWFYDPIIKTYEELDSLHFPDPDDDAVLEPVVRMIRENPDKAVIVDIIGPITILHAMRLMDNIYLDVYDCPERLHKALKRISDISLRVLERVLELKLDVAGIYMLDDIAGSSALLMSPAMLDEFLFDYMKPGIAMAKAAGKKLLYHSDGNLTDILGHLAELGFDAVNPMQIWFNDLQNFNRKYRKKLVCFGGIDNTRIVPFGTPQEIWDHVQWLFENVGAEGDLIFATHMIDPATPVENYMALFEAMTQCIY